MRLPADAISARLRNRAVIGAVPLLVMAMVLGASASPSRSVARTHADVVAGAESPVAAPADASAAAPVGAAAPRMAIAERAQQHVVMPAPPVAPPPATAPKPVHKAAPVKKSSGSTGGSSGSSGTSMSSAASAVFAAVNNARASHGLPALRWSGGLALSAQRHDSAMAAANSLSHQLPGEAGLGARESAAGVSWTWAGECIGETSSMTTSGALGLVSSMLAEVAPNDGHKQIILSTSANSLGVDVMMDSAHGRLWLTMDFAKS